MPLPASGPFVISGIGIAGITWRKLVRSFKRQLHSLPNSTGDGMAGGRKLALDPYAGCAHEYRGLRNRMVFRPADPADPYRPLFISTQLVLIFAAAGFDLWRFRQVANSCARRLVVDVAAAFGLVFHHAGRFNDQ